MSGPSAPPPGPSAAEIAAQTAASNKATAVSQAGLNATNQITPQGSLTYTQVGTWPDGTPRFEATTALNAGEQGVYNTDVANRAAIGQIGTNQISRVGEALSSPVELGGAAGGPAEARLAELGRARLDPAFAQKQAALETSLANKGITMGSAAYNNAMSLLNQQQTDAYNQLFLGGRNQANQEIMAMRSTPLNELNAFRSMSQVSNPNWVQTPQTNVAPTDTAGIYANQRAADLKQFQIEQSQQNAMLGGLFGLGGTALGGWTYGGFKSPFGTPA